MLKNKTKTKRKYSTAVLKSAFDTTKVKILKRGDIRTLVEIIEGSMKGQKIEVLNKNLHSLKKYKDLHNLIYH